MGLSDKLIGALFQYKGEALHIMAGDQVAVTARGQRKPISQRAITPDQIVDILGEIAPPEVAGKTGTFEFVHQTPNGPVTVKVENIAGQRSIDIVPGGAVVAANVVPDLAPLTPGGGGGPAAPARAAAPRAPAPAPAPAAPAPRPAPAPVTREGAPAIERFFMVMVNEGASDLHLTSNNPPLYRKDGDIVQLGGDTRKLSAEEVHDLLWPIAPEMNREEFTACNDTDFAYAIPGVARFRCNFFMDRHGPGAVFRVIPSKILTAEDLKLSQHILDLCWLSKGLVIVTGPTGSGKSTTLAAMIDYINRKRSAHIITVEDPIEFVHETKQCLINQRQIGVHTNGFKPALRAALREDPDIVLVGEMRDLETIHIAIETAETGHLVFGTLHTNTAPSTVDRVIDQFPADEQAQIRTMLSESLKAVVAQTLCKKIGGGRIAALEILMVTPPVSNLIREGKTFQIPSAMQTGKNVGMVTLNDALAKLVIEGKVEPNEAYLKAVDKPGIKSILERAGKKVTIQ